jgi:hypothetical protein
MKHQLDHSQMPPLINERQGRGLDDSQNLPLISSTKEAMHVHRIEVIIPKGEFYYNIED